MENNLVNNNRKTTLVLLMTNLITIFLAVIQNWDLATMVWIYWFQSVVIGLFQVKKILDLKEFSTKDFRINGNTVLPNQQTKIETIMFFIFHYGFFHFVYAVFLSENKGILWLSVLASSIMFFMNHLFSYREHKEVENQKVKNIGSMMFFPYIRIIPMHLMIVFAFSSTVHSLVFFLILKTIADVAMHLVEHKV